MVLRDWVEPNKLNWSNLSTNPNAIDLLKQHIYKIDWSRISYNPNAMPIIEKHFNKVNWVKCVEKFRGS